VFAQIQIDDGFRGRGDALVDDEIAEVGLVFFADGRFERDGLLGDRA
jgi:hypothetical protein